MATPLIVGRARERASLLAAIDAASGGRPQLVFVSGEAGIGKTTLVDDVARHVATGGRRVVRGSADALDVDGFALWAGPRRQLGLTAIGDDRWDVLDAVAEALDSAAPLLVVLEDVHWADDESLWLLGQLPSFVRGNVAIVATGRHDAPPRVRPSATIVLRGLDAAAVAQLIDDAAIDAAAVCERTGGNPLFVQHVVERGVTAQLPSAIGVALAHALDALDSAVLRSLAVIALAGADAPTSVIAEVAGVSVAMLDAHVQAAARAGVLVAAADATRRFRHALLADAVVERIDITTRRAFDAGLADAWAATSGGAGLARTALHRLRAVPVVDALLAIEEACSAARQLRDSGNITAAANVLTAAADVLAAHRPDAVDVLGRVLVDLGEALVTVGRRAESLAAFDRAINLGLNDKDLHIAAVIGACRQLHMHFAEPIRRVQLLHAETLVAEGDHPLRVLLLGRLAVAEAGDPLRWAEARVHGDAAVAMARRLNDPAVLATSLIDRHVYSRDLTDLEARSAVADELIDLGRRTRRPETVMVGLQWRYSDGMRRADLELAHAALDEMETLAALSPSPEWRFAVLIRRGILAAIAGNRDEAISCVGQAVPLGRQVLFASEASGIETGARVVISRITGIDDPSLAELLADLDASGGPPPTAFFQIHLAAVRLGAGDVLAAREATRRWAAWAAEPGHAVEEPSIAVVLAGLVADLGLVEHARQMYDVVLPYSGCLSTESGFAGDLPVDVTLMRLAMVLGDDDAARRHLHEAMRVARAAGSPWLEARCRGLGPDSTVSSEPPVAPAARVGTLVRRGSGWRIESPYGNGEVANSIGLGQLARLLAAAPADVTATELAGMIDVAPARDLGPMLDASAKRAYRRRVEELRAEIDDADDAYDIERASRARIELDALIDELRRAVGLRGRDRPSGAGAERARVNVARSIRRAVDAVRVAVPGLGAHLDVSIRTGRVCSYSAEPAAALTWTVSEVG